MSRGRLWHRCGARACWLEVTISIDLDNFCHTRLKAHPAPILFHSLSLAILLQRSPLTPNRLPSFYRSLTPKV
jgi:hypothetical protein